MPDTARRPRQLAWLALALAGLPGVAFAALAVPIGIALAFVLLASIALAHFASLDHLVIALTCGYLLVAWATAPTFPSDGSDWFALTLLASVVSAIAVFAKIGRLLGVRVWRRDSMPLASR